MRTRAVDLFVIVLTATAAAPALAAGSTAGPSALAAGTPGRLTPESAVALALESFPGLRAAGFEVAGAEADRALARSGYLPRLDLTEDYARSTNPVFVFASKLGQETFGPQDFAIDSLNRPDPFTNAATRVVLRQNIWDAGRTHLGSEAAALGIEAARRARTRTRDEVVFGALKAFWDAVIADEMLRVAESAEEVARANAALAAHQVEAGMAVASDRLLAGVRLAEVQAMRIRAEQGMRVARAALRQALGLTDDRAFELAAPAVEPSDPAGTAEDRVTVALAARPDLLALDRRIAQAGVGEKIARSRYLPEVGLGAQYEWNDPDPFGSTGDNWTVAASLRVPIFDGLETRARLLKARADRDRLRALREAMAEGIRLQVRAAWAERVSAAERLRVTDSALGQAEEALRIVRERYAEGMAIVVELLGAEAQRTAAQGNRAAAVRDLAIAEASLDLASGGAPERGGAPAE